MKPFQKLSSPIIYISIFAFSILSSCNKDNETPATAKIPLIATASFYTELGSVPTKETFEYDSQGRLTTIISSAGESTTIEYNSQTILLKHYSNGNLLESVSATLNSKGLCTSMSSDVDNYLIVFEYDTNDYEVSELYTQSTWSDKTTFRVTDSNYSTIIYDYGFTSTASALKNMFDPISMIFTNRNTLIKKLKSAETFVTYQADYQFYKDKINTNGNENRGILFLGKQNKNPIQCEIVTTVNATAAIHNYSYEYDNKGRITRQSNYDGTYFVYTYIE